MPKNFTKRQSVVLRAATRKRKSRQAAWACIAAAAASVAAVGRASTTRFFQAGGGGSWTNPFDWSPQGTPAAGDNINIQEPSASSVIVFYDYTGAAVTLGTLNIDEASAPPNVTAELTLTTSGLALTATNEQVGASGAGSNGNGTIFQSDGTNIVNSQLELGVNPTDRGFYTLSNVGILSTSIEYIGVNGTGTFVQSSTGFQHIGVLELGVSFGSTGTYSMSNGQITAQASEIIGDGGVGIFNQTFGNNIVEGSGFILAGSGGRATYNLSGTSLLEVVGTQDSIGNVGVANFNQSGGTHDAGLSTPLNIGVAAGAFGAYTLSSVGILTAEDGENIGVNGTGSFIQTGGSNTISSINNLIIGVNAGSVGSYTLSGNGVLNVGNNEVIAEQGTGTFTQTGGTNIVGPGGLAVGLNSKGTFNLSGTGALDSPNGESIGNTFGTGIFNQTGGTNTTNILIVGNNGTGTYTISGGSLNVGATGFIVSTGVLTVSGTGAVVSESILSVIPNGVVNLNGGSITAAGLITLGQPSDFNWTTGVLTFTSSATFDPASGIAFAGDAFGNALTLGNGQTFQITADETLGGTGSFTMTLNSGSSHVVTGSLTVSPTGVFTQNSGSNLFAANFIQAGGIVNGQLQNQGLFTYQSGLFNAQLINQGSISFVTSFVAGNGIQNQSAITVNSGQTLTANGLGFDNQGTLTLNGGTISGSTFLNDFGGTITGFGAINPAATNDGALNLQGVLRINNSFVNDGNVSGAGTIIGNFSNASAGSITVSQQLAISSAWTNAGLTSLQGSGVLGGGTITNTGTIQGNGQITAAVSDTTGTIRPSGGALTLQGALTIGAAGQIQAATGGTIMVDQGLTTNNGTISLSGGTFDNNNRPLSNASTGSIFGYGTFLSGGLTNNGAFTLGGATSSLYGPVTNNANMTFAGSTFIYGNITNAANQNAVIAGTSPNQFYGTFSNTGTLTVVNSASGYLYGAYTGTGPIKNNGTLYVNANSISGNISGGGILILGAAGLPTNFRILTNSGTNAQNGIVINSGSTLDIANNTLVINYGTPAGDPISTIVGYLKNGYNSGAWTGANGIISTTAAAGTNPTLSVGYADGNTDVGTPAAPNQVVVKYTLAGDANLDGLVNFNDLVAVVQNFNKGGTDWAHANFGYGTSTDFTDLVAVIQNFNKTLIPAASSDSSSGGTTVALGQSAQIQSTDVQLPEPGSVMLIAAGASALLARRRRR